MSLYTFLSRTHFFCRLHLSTNHTLFKLCICIKHLHVKTTPGWEHHTICTRYCTSGNLRFLSYHTTVTTEITWPKSLTVITVCIASSYTSRAWKYELIVVHEMYFLILAWTKYCIWTVLKELIVRQTLTPTRDHPPNSPHCTHIAGYKSEGEVCIWSAVGAQRVKRPVIRPKLFIPQEIIDQAGYRAQVVLEVSLGLGLGDRRSLPLNVHYPVLSCLCPVLYCVVLHCTVPFQSDHFWCRSLPVSSTAVPGCLWIGADHRGWCQQP